MSDLKLVSDEVTGLIHIKEDSQFNSIKADMVILAENVTVRLFGDIGDIVLKKGSLVYVHGTVTGNIENRGGDIHIFYS